MMKVKALIQKEFLEQRWMLTTIYVTVILVAIFTLYAILGTNGHVEEAPGKIILSINTINHKSVEGFDTLVALGFAQLCYVSQIIYFLGSCFNERIDKSIAFWRSMPVSDSMSILTKMAVGLVIIPMCWAVATFSAIIISSIIFSFWHMDSILYISLAWSQLITCLVKSVHDNFFLSPLFLSLMLFSSLAKRSPALLTAAVGISGFFIDRAISSLFGMSTTTYQLIRQFYSHIFSGHSTYGFTDYILPITGLLLINILAFMALVSIRKRYT